ncbi:MAG TPA: hypothetical protein VFH27_08785 [Longimicrobiaceae bacterium]|nr:hypothetical protein [Longimicrobiaceae bacterium]
MNNIRSIAKATLRAAFVALALTAGRAATLRAQIVLTDGWSIYTDRNGVIHYIPPGYVFVPLPDGGFAIVPGPPPPPPPPPPPDRLASGIAPSVGFAFASFARRHAAVGDAYMSRGIVHQPAFEANMSAAASFRLHDAASVSVLHGFIEEEALARLQWDLQQIHASVAELGTKGHMDARSFRALRGAALRVRDAVADAVPAAAASEDPARRAAAARALDRLVHQLQVLLPMLSEMEARASRRAAR